MAFVMMTTKWCILQKPMHTRVSKIKYIFLEIAKLHNYCINELITRGEQELQDTEEIAVYHTASTVHNEDNTPVDDHAAVDNLYSSFESLAGQSLTREQMVMRILEMKLERPSRSVLYQKAKRQETSPC
jgi:hypothetical protein